MLINYYPWAIHRNAVSYFRGIMIETRELGDGIECLLYEKDVQGSCTS